MALAHDVVDHAVGLFRHESEHQLTQKGDRDYATETDYRIERELRARLATDTPEIGFLGEEGGHTGNDNRYWCLDPIDGTVNYVHGNPLCGVSLALVEDDVSTLGVIDLPRLGDRYSAATGCGAFRGEDSIGVATPAHLGDAVISLGDFAVGERAVEKNRLRLDVVEALVSKVLRLRMIGSAAADLAWVADGKLDGAIVAGSHPWDLAAGCALVREAGGIVAVQSIGQTDFTIAGSPAVVASLATVIDDARARASHLATPPMTGRHPQ